MRGWVGILLLGMPLSGFAADQLDFDKLWDYENPVGTRNTFQALLPKAKAGEDRSYYFQLLTQIARTYSLTKDFKQAHATLDQVDKKAKVKLPIVRMRYLLERGRALNSAGKKDMAGRLFVEAFEFGKKQDIGFYAVDAAHMVVLAAKSFDKKVLWIKKGISLAETSKDQRARYWLGALHNNLGWDYHDRKRYSTALKMFQKSLEYYSLYGKPGQTTFANWAVARAKRSLGDLEGAMKIQLKLEAQNQASGGKDGYVFEELGEILMAKKEPARARHYFRLAYLEFVKSKWFRENEGKRLDRIKRIARL